MRDGNYCPAIPPMGEEICIMIERKLKKWNLLSAALAVFMTALALVSCAPAELQKSDSDNVSLYFGYLEAKSVNETAYNVSTKKAEWGSSTVQVGNANNYYWSYTAVKGDNLFKAGETSTQTSVSTGTGLSGTRNFSKGKWTFTLYAYKTAEQRTQGTQYIFKGEKTGTWTSGGSVDIPVSYSYIAGTGTANFNFTVNLSQEDASTFGTTYKITKVVGIVNGTRTNLTNSSGNSWTGTASSASGNQTVGIEVYVDNETNPRVSNANLGKAVILHGLTTDICGTATIGLTAAKTSITFSPTLPTEQPTASGFPITAPSDVQVGDILTMGKIPSTASVAAGTDITWKVLEVDSTNKRALVISEKLLKTMEPYTAATSSNCASYTYSWADCDINTYLNGSFISDYGLSNVSMASVSHETEYYTFADNSSSGTAGTATTSSEKVFLLSVAEVNSYFANKKARVAQDLCGSETDWWLRSPGSYRCYSVAGVNYCGDVLTDGSGVDSERGLRPAFWISL